MCVIARNNLFNSARVKTLSEKQKVHFVVRHGYSCVVIFMCGTEFFVYSSSAEFSICVGGACLPEVSVKRGSRVEYNGEHSRSGLLMEPDI